MKTNYLITTFILMLLASNTWAQFIAWQDVSTGNSWNHSVTKTQAGNYLVCGYEVNNEEMLASMYSPSGQLIWEKCILDAPFGFYFYGVELDDERLLFFFDWGDVYITDSIGGNRNLLLYLYPPNTGTIERVKVSRTGNELLLSQEVSFDGDIGRMHTIFDLSTLSIKNQIFLLQGGELQASAIFDDQTFIECVGVINGSFELRRVHFDGTVIWVKEYDPILIRPKDLLIASNQNIYLAGFAYDFVNEYSYGILSALDPDGNQLWMKNYDRSTGYDEREFMQIKEGAEGQLILRGIEKDVMPVYHLDMSIIKCDLEGRIIWELTQLVCDGSDYFSDLIIDEKGDLVISGNCYVESTIPNIRRAVVKIIDDTNSSSELNPKMKWFVYPSPASDYLNIDFRKQTREGYTIEIFDAKGNLLKQPNHLTNIDISNFPVGIYWIRISGENQSWTQKWVKGVD